MVVLLIQGLALGRGREAGANVSGAFAKSHLICAGSSEKSGGTRFFNFTRRKSNVSGAKE
jgi:hypothetical protein